MPNEEYTNVDRQPICEWSTSALIAERDRYKHEFIDSATEWGAAYGVACKYVRAIEKELARREGISHD